MVTADEMNVYVSACEGVTLVCENGDELGVVRELVMRVGDVLETLGGEMETVEQVKVMIPKQARAIALCWETLGKFAITPGSIN